MRFSYSVKSVQFDDSMIDVTGRTVRMLSRGGAAQRPGLRMRPCHDRGHLVGDVALAECGLEGGELSSGASVAKVAPYGARLSKDHRCGSSVRL